MPMLHKSPHACTGSASRSSFSAARYSKAPLPFPSIPFVLTLTLVCSLSLVRSRGQNSLLALSLSLYCFSSSAAQYAGPYLASSSVPAGMFLVA